jgi:hypothetical protein
LRAHNSAKPTTRHEKTLRGFPPGRSSPVSISRIH